MTVLGAPAPTVITFDFYGTLVMWNEGLRDVFARLLLRKMAHGVSPDDLAHRFHAVGRLLRDTPPYRPYREILKESLRRALLATGLPFEPEDYAELRSTIEGLGPHPEVPAALTRLKSRYRLALISNSDDDLIGMSVPNLGVPVDGVITAQQARAYKPDPELFRTAHRTLGVIPSDVVHVAASMPLDMPVCKQLGIRAIWVNRRGEFGDDAHQPYAEVTDLDGAMRLLMD